MSKPENPSAFPSPMIPEWSEGANGMSLRDWFAGRVLDGLHGIPLDKREAESVAQRCYMTADAMLAERAKGGAA